MYPWFSHVKKILCGKAFVEKEIASVRFSTRYDNMKNVNVGKHSSCALAGTECCSLLMDFSRRYAKDAEPKKSFRS